MDASTGLRGGPTTRQDKRWPHIGSLATGTFFYIYVLFTLVTPFYTADSRTGPYDEETTGRLTIAREG